MTAVRCHSLVISVTGWTLVARIVNSFPACDLIILECHHLTLAYHKGQPLNENNKSQSMGSMDSIYRLCHITNIKSLSAQPLQELSEHYSRLVHSFRHWSISGCGGIERQSHR